MSYEQLQTHLKEEKGFQGSIPGASTSEMEKHYVDFHVYLDIDYVEADEKEQGVQKVSIEAIVGKVHVYETFDALLVNANLKKPYRNTLYYGEWSYSFRYGFEEIKQSEIKKKIKGCASSNPVSSNSSMNETKVHPKQNQMSNDVQIISDDSDIEVIKPTKKSIMTPNDDDVLHDSANKISESVPKEMRLKEKKKLKKNKKKADCEKQVKRLKKKDILSENEKKISVEDKNEMKRICDKIGIEMNIGVQLYGFKNEGYLAVYKCVLDLIENYDDKEREFEIYEKGCSFLRDIHAAVKAKGRRGNAKEMKPGIVEKLKNLKLNMREEMIESDNENNADEDDANLAILAMENKPLRRRRLKRKLSPPEPINESNKRQKTEDQQS